MAYERFRFDDPKRAPCYTATIATVHDLNSPIGPVCSKSSSVAADACERVAIAVEDGGVPSVYAAAWTHLQAGPPIGMDHTRWMQARDDAAAFLDKWGVAAARLGWPAHHLFEAPRGWIGGLVWEIGGGAVVALTDRQAIIAQGTRKLWFCIPPHTGHDRETRNG